MAYALGFTIGSTLERNTHYKQQAGHVLMEISRWLRGKTATLDFSREDELALSVIETELALNEARNVVQNLQRVIDPGEARKILLQILDDCLEGYALLRDVSRKRTLFNWWLVEVVPAAWCMRLPKVIYQAGEV
jgi:hypothetical protein